MHGKTPNGDASSTGFGTANNTSNYSSNYNNYNSEVFNSGYNNSSYGNYNNSYSAPSNLPSNNRNENANYYNNKNPATNNSNTYNPISSDAPYNPAPSNNATYNPGNLTASAFASNMSNTGTASLGNYNQNNSANNNNNNNNASARDAPSLSVASRYQYNPNPEANPSPSQKAVYNYSNDEKAKRIVPLEKNPSLYGHAGASMNGNLLICGGYNGLVNTNQFYVLQTTSSKSSMLPTALFSQIKPTGDSLDLKERHTMTALGKLCFIFGGYMRISEKHYANMHVFDTDALTLTLLNTHGEVPSARCGHCAVVVGNVIYYFGGRSKSKSMQLLRLMLFAQLIELGKDEYLNDLYCFNPSTASWTLCYTTGTTPMGRSLATLTLVERKLYLFGGAHSTGTRDTTGFCDLHELDLDTMVWREVEANSQLPLPCYGHSATYIGAPSPMFHDTQLLGNNKILMFGGKGFAVTNNINVFNIEHSFSGNALRKRWGHTASLHGNLLVLFGGKGDNANVYWDNFDLVDIELQEIKPDQYELKKERDELESKEWVNNQINYLTGDIDELRVLVCLLADDILAESQNEKSLEIERTLKEMKDMQATLKEKSAKLSLLM